MTAPSVVSKHPHFGTSFDISWNIYATSPSRPAWASPLSIVQALIPHFKNYFNESETGLFRLHWHRSIKAQFPFTLILVNKAYMGLIIHVRQFRLSLIRPDQPFMECTLQAVLSPNIFPRTTGFTRTVRRRINSILGKKDCIHTSRVYIFDQSTNLTLLSLKVKLGLTCPRLPKLTKLSKVSSENERLLFTNSQASLDSCLMREYRHECKAKIRHTDVASMAPKHVSISA